MQHIHSTNVANCSKISASKSAWAVAQFLSLGFSALYCKPVRKPDISFLLTPSPSSSGVFFFSLAGEAGSTLGFSNVFLGCALAFIAAGLAGGCFLLAPMAAVGEIANVSMAAHKLLAARSINMFHYVTTSLIISFCTLIMLPAPKPLLTLHP